MTLTTTKHSFPKPESTDPPNGPLQIGDLADDIDALWPVRFKGKSIVSTEQTISHGGSVDTFDLAPTPDRVSNVILPTDGLIAVHFRALAKYAGSAIGEAAIFLGSNQLKTISVSGAPAVQKGLVSDAEYQWIWSIAQGLNGGTTGSGNASDGVTTGLSLGVLGSMCYIEAAAGTYDVSVKWRNQLDAGSESVTIKDRRLRVWSMEF